tara:strand:- start:1206 stop:1628 length:423 start_codon:yes stop_codon:yes gene_type:complete
MAIINASITLTSSDMMDNVINLSNTTVLTKAGNDTGLSETTGLARKKTSSGSNTILLDTNDTTGSDVTASKAAKVYIKNINDRGDGTKYVTILLEDTEIGRLYGGDWLFMPWDATGSGKDIEFTASDTTETTIEYICFFE